jgi:hypothetical protein
MVAKGKGKDKDKLRAAIGLALPLCGQAIPTAETLPGLLTLVDILLAKGWLPPGMHAAAGRASAAKRYGVPAIRRILIEHRILPELPAQYRQHRYSDLTITEVHRRLRAFGTSEYAGNSAVLKSCRTVSRRTVAKDLAQISPAQIDRPRTRSRCGQSENR